MSARVIISTLGTQSREDETGDVTSPNRNPTQTQMSTEAAAKDLRHEADEATLDTEELLRRYNIPYPLPSPWDHGGLNE